MQRFLKKLCFTTFVVLQTLILVSCGGGGSSSSTGGTSSPNNSNDGGPVTVKMASPSPTTNVPLNTIITLQFSGAVSNVTTSTVKLMESDPVTGTPVSISSPVAGANNTFVFQSSKDLLSNTKYYVVVDTGIVSLSNNQSVAATNFSFTTGNYVAPMAVLMNPGNESTGVSTSTNIQIHFNESVSNVGTSTVLLHESDPTSNPIPMTMSNIVNENTYTFTPVTLKPGTKYYVEVTSGVKSAITGVALDDTEFTFTTSQTLNSPTVSILTPESNELIESAQPAMIIYFSESVSNVNTSTVILHAGSPTGESVAISLVESFPDHTYEFMPNNSLTANTTYYLEVTSGITSIATGAPVVDTEFNFTIQSPAYAYILDANGVYVCGINSIGGFATCNSTGFGKNAAAVRTSAVNSAIYLVSQESRSISSCPIDKSTGNVISCTDSKLYDTPSSIVITKDGKYAYITTVSGDNAVWYCKLSESDQSLQSCNETGYPVNSGPDTLPLVFSYASSITLDATNTYAYISDAHDNSITTCTVSGDRNLTNCTELKDSLVNTPTGLSVSTSGNHLYAIGNKSDLLTVAIDPASGILSNPANVYSRFTAASDTASYDNKLYVSDFGNGAISMCHQDSATGGVHACYFVGLNFVKASGIAILN